MSKNTRKDISTEALLRMGGIKRLLDEVNGTQPTDSNVEGPALVLDDFDDEKEKPLAKGNKIAVTKGVSETDNKETERKFEDKPTKSIKGKGNNIHKPSKQNRDKDSASSKAVSFQSQGKFSTEDWGKILSLVNDYHHAIDRGSDKTVFIEGDIMAVLRLCLGHRASRFINVMLRIFIESNKDIFKAMHSKQCKLLK